jgi:glycosyltransferase involved in cell wall biosynthesis
MRILLVVHSPPLVESGAGGTEIYTFTLARELGRSEEVLVFTRVSEPDLPEYTISRRTYQGVEYEAVNNTYRWGDDFELHYHNPSLNKPFYDCLKEFRPQIVHFTYALGGLSASFVRLARESGAGVVFTLTDYNFICPWGQLLTSDGKICEGPREGLNCLPCFFKEELGSELGIIRKWMVDTLPAPLAVRLVKHPRVLKVNRRIRFLRRSLQEADLIIAPTRSLSSRYLKWGIEKDKLMNSSLGIDTRLFGSTAKIPAERVRFGFIGQPLPHKGLHILTEAFSRLERDGELKGDWELRIYGEPTSEEAREYLKRAREGKDPERFRYLGSFPHQEIARIYAELDVLVIPSLWEENSPLVLLYALHTRTPIIASRVGGITELVAEGKDGMLFEVGQVGELSAKLREFIQEPDRLRASRKVPVKSIEENARELKALYNQLLK